MTELAQAAIGGTCSDRFAKVRDAFAANFERYDEIGAAFAVTYGGELVADLHGGWADPARTRPWSADTVANVWSTTKGVQATCYAMAVDRGLVDYDQPVVDFWPEFGAEGKDRVTVGQLLSHQAGLCGFATPAGEPDVVGGSQAAARLVATHVAVFIFYVEGRMRRMLAFLDPWQYHPPATPVRPAIGIGGGLLMGLGPIDPDLDEVIAEAGQQQLAEDPLVALGDAAIGEAAEGDRSIGACRRHRRLLELGVAGKLELLLGGSDFVVELPGHGRVLAAGGNAPAEIEDLHADDQTF